MKDVNILTSNGVNVQQSLELFGDMELYDETLNDFLDMSDEKRSNLEKFKATNDMPNYAIAVHALKSDARYLGFLEFGDLCYDSEMKAKAGNSDAVMENHSKVIEGVNKMISIASQYLGKSNSAATSVEPAQAQPQPAQAQSQPVQAQPQPVQAQPQPAQAQPHPAQAQPQPVQAQPQPAQAQSQPVQAQPQPVQAQPQPVQAQPQPVQAQPQPAQAQPHPAQAQPQPVQAQPQPAQAQSQPVQAQSQPVQAQPQPVQAQPQNSQSLQPGMGQQLQYSNAVIPGQPMVGKGFENHKMSSTVEPKQGTILVVDDSNLVANFVKKIFNSRYDVVIAKDGAKAIELCQNSDFRSKIKTCLLDLNMPNVNGYAVLEHFKQKGYFVKMPVAVVSGVEDMDSIDKVNKYPIVDVLSKPFNERDVQRVVEKCLATYF